MMVYFVVYGSAGRFGWLTCFEWCGVWVGMFWGVVVLGC